jgi:hypothetical protein
MSNHVADTGVIELVELLCLAVESCRVADSLVAVAVALQRIAGVGTGADDLAEVRHDAERLVGHGVGCRQPGRAGQARPAMSPATPTSAAVTEEVEALCRRLRLK